MRSSLTISLVACGLVFAAGSAETKPVRAHHSNPIAKQAPTEQAQDDEDDAWSGPVARNQRGSRWYGHGIGWSVSPDGYFATPAAPTYHDGMVTPGYAFDGPEPES